MTSDRSQAIYRWGMALLLMAAIAISYLDRQTLPLALQAVQADIPFNNMAKAALDSAFLMTYGLMYLGGGLLLDRIGTRQGFLLIMAVWSLACASHGLAGGLLALAASRLILGIGEGGGFPAATRAVSEGFAPKDRATAMGLINAGTAIGAVAAWPLIAWVLNHAHWAGLAAWRWVFFLTGGLGLAWVALWALLYRTPPHADTRAEPPIRLRDLLRHRAVWAIVIAKFLSDGAWYFYLFWLPKYLFDSFHIDLKTAAGFGWIPYAAAGAGAVLGGGLSSLLLRLGLATGSARKIALGVSAALMPWVMLAPQMHTIAPVILVFSLAFFGQQSWSTLIMVLPTDLIPHRAVGTLAGLVGFGGAMGGIVLGQVAGALRDQGFSYQPVLIVSGSLHLIGLVLICGLIPQLRPLDFTKRAQRL